MIPTSRPPSSRLLLWASYGRSCSLDANRRRHCEDDGEQPELKTPTACVSASPIHSGGTPDMPHDARELKFLATPEKGEVSALLVRPEGATHLLVLGHGASTNMRHATLQSIADQLAEVGIATFRYNFPYSENGKGRDGQAACTATIRSAVAAAHEAAPDLPLLAGGHSFSGRMTSTAESESPLDRVIGLVFFSSLPTWPASPTRSVRTTSRTSPCRCSS